MHSELKEYKKEFGDYQTPLYFARRVLSYLDECYDLNPDVVVEPTCGVGKFIVASREVYPSSRVVGIDVNEEYLSRVSVVAEDVLLFNECVFSFDFDSKQDYSS